MAEVTIPVDPTNPGQVFACLGLMETAEILLGDASAGFDWAGDQTRFMMTAAGDENPVEVVIRFLAGAEVVTIAPDRQNDAWPAHSIRTEIFPAALKDLRDSKGKKYASSALPVILKNEENEIEINHWVDGAHPREPFKTFAGQQVGGVIVEKLLASYGTRRQAIGVADIWRDGGESLIADPFSFVGNVESCFGFDARGAWSAISIGASFDRLNIGLLVSPLVEVLAAIGLTNARPLSVSTYVARYSIWRGKIPPFMARAALSSKEAMMHREARWFITSLGDDKYYKKFFQAVEE